MGEFLEKAHDDATKLPHFVKRALVRLRDRDLIRQVSSSEEAIAKGDGHLFFTHPDGKAFGTASGLFCIGNGLVEPMGDDLFGTGSQTYRLTKEGRQAAAAFLESGR
ncbi:hypothetical protein [Nitratireductor sp. StC3]|uniref:hypothetical protein n=1 Tax=Nitratireductor sp. StC3 TaxID=2126741 RepID=UPI000D0DB559|nr:hypothetical protein [Nitratireductor sp. StC3]PSM18240.1 hypothetical protein C7T96_10240 [Nitratireductor sp. StC3]